MLFKLNGSIASRSPKSATLHKIISNALSEKQNSLVNYKKKKFPFGINIAPALMHFRL